MILPFNWEGKPPVEENDIYEVIDVAHLKVPYGHGANSTGKRFAKITIRYIPLEGYCATLWWFNRGIEMARHSPSVEDCKRAAHTWWVEFLTPFLV